MTLAADGDVRKGRTAARVLAAGIFFIRISPTAAPGNLTRWITRQPRPTLKPSQLVGQDAMSRLSRELSR
jgi:hypothetical protein